MALLRRVRVRGAGAAVPVAASCAAVAVLAAASLAGCGSQAPAAVTSASASRQDPVAACDKPSTSFARFWFLTVEPDPGVYQGTVRVGSARVPALSMYVSGGAPGAGTLCVSADKADTRGPIQATAAPRQGPIAYVGTAGNPRDTVYFATRPGIARVTMSAPGARIVYTYTLDGPAECIVFSTECRLEPLGNGWHAVGTGFGMGGVTSVILRAYNTAGHLMETVTEPITAPAPSQPAAASSTPTR